MSLKDFLDYVVLPFVATLLISQGLKVGEKEAEETRIARKSYGFKFNCDADDCYGISRFHGCSSIVCIPSACQQET